MGFCRNINLDLERNHLSTRGLNEQTTKFIRTRKDTNYVIRCLIRICAYLVSVLLPHTTIEMIRLITYNICVQFEECVYIFVYRAYISQLEYCQTLMMLFLNTSISQNWLPYSPRSRPFSSKIISNLQIFMVTLLPIL